LFAAQTNLGNARTLSRIHVGEKANARPWAVFLWLLALFTVVHGVVAALAPAAEDELYYWNWSQHLGPSYFDHPPLTAWAIRLSTSIFGDTVFAIRVPAIVFSTTTIFTIAAMSPQASLASLLLFTPLFFLGSVVMTPDLPLAAFWILYLAWTCRIQALLESWNCDPVSRVYHKSPISPLDWLLGGVILGLGLLSKYTMLLAVGCSLVTFFTKTAVRAWWKGYALHLFVAGLLGLPVLVFNYEHGFLPLKFQWEHIQQHGQTWGRFFDFWGGQALLVGLVPLFFLPRIGIQWRYLWNDPRYQPCLVFFLLPGAYFFYKSMTANLEANWILVMYLAFWPIAQRICQISSFKGWNTLLLIVGFLPCWIASAALVVHAFRPLDRIPPYKDRLRVSQARAAVSRQAANDLMALERIPFFSGGYQWTSVLRFAGISAEQLPSGRISHFTLRPQDPCSFKKVHYWHNSQHPLPAEVSCFKNIAEMRSYPVVVRGQQLENLQILELSH
jgi:4-amino-4-deoxy-L-arabinose transferase-like glycosyltransferase